jgi:hypothetical protein
MLAFVIPTPRESRNIRLMFTGMRTALGRCGRAHEVIVVDDASAEGIRFRLQFDLALRLVEQERANGCS